ncbi:MAG: arginine--tRNA ligase [Tepidisphaerales bacterium]
MPTALQTLEKAFREAIREVTGIEADPLVQPSGNPELADYQSNAAMGLVRQVSASGGKTTPRLLAERIREAVEPKLAGVAGEVAVAGPGFINVRLAPAYVAKRVEAMLRDPLCGVEPTPNPQRVVVDYCGVNAAKEMHVGHLRSTIIGDAVCNVLEALGHTVIRQNHVGDWGTQFGMLIAHLETAGAQGEGGTGKAQPGGGTGDTGGVAIRDLEAFYRAAKQRFDTDPAFAELARKKVVALQSGDPSARQLWTHILNATRDHYERVCRRLGVRLTRADERGESSYNDDLPNVVRELKEKGLAVESEGAVAVFIDGPEKPPLIVEKSGGGYLYGTTDLAAARYRAGVLKADRVLYFVDQRQSQHFAQVFKTAAAAGWTGQTRFEHAGFGTMMGPDGKPFKTRSGDVVKLEELLDEAEERALAVVREKNPDLPPQRQREVARAVGIGAVKYADLSKDRISDYVFDWNRMLSLEGNTAVYLQYAYARVRGIFRKGGIDPSAVHGQVCLETPSELALGKHLIRFPEVLESVARELKPHMLCTYLYELAGRFSVFYGACEVLSAATGVRESRLLLSEATARTLRYGLGLLGIECPEEI